jgi:hypothetical protein
VESLAAPVWIDADALPDSVLIRAETDPAAEENVTQDIEHSHASTAAALAPVVAVGVGLAASKPTNPWAEEVDRALAKLPADWSRTKALWRVRKPR